MKFLYYSLIVLVSVGWFLQPVNGVSLPDEALAPAVVNNPVVQAPVVQVVPATRPVVIAANIGVSPVCQNQGGLNLNQPASCFTWVRQPPLMAAVKIVVGYASVDAAVAVLKIPAAVMNPGLAQPNAALPAIPALSLAVFTLAVIFEFTRRGLAAKDAFTAPLFAGFLVKYFFPVVLRC